MRYFRHVLLACVLGGFAGTLGATQPVDRGYQVVAQPPGECASTATWLMLAYYYDGLIVNTELGNQRVRKSSSLGAKARRSWYNPSLPEVCVGRYGYECSGWWGWWLLGRGGAQRNEIADISEWIDVQRGGRLGPSLRHIANRLGKMRRPGTGERLFEVSGEFNPVRSDEEERARRLEQIREHLDDGRPVIVHLARSAFIAGHYVTLVGHRNTWWGRRYIYVDTANPEEGEVRVSEKDLLGTEPWYSDSDSPDAYWNGIYLTFWPMPEGDRG